MATPKKIESLKNAWISSITLFLPANLKLFFLVTLNTAFQAFITLITVFYPLLIIWIIAEFFYFTGFNFFGLIPLLIVARFTLFYILLLTIRPSIALKNYSYYISYLGYSLIYIVGILGLMVLFSSESFITQLIKYTLLIPPAAFYCSPFVLFILLFYLDSDGGLQEALKSIYRALIMLLYNYPFCFIIFFMNILLLHFFYVGTFWLFLFISPWGIAQWSAYLLSTILIPFIVSFIVNFYIKKVHEQINLYVPGCKQ